MRRLQRLKHASNTTRTALQHRIVQCKHLSRPESKAVPAVMSLGEQILIKGCKNQHGSSSFSSKGRQTQANSRTS